MNRKVGGVGSAGETPATAEVQAMCNNLRTDIFEAARNNNWKGDFAKFKAIAFKTQVLIEHYSIIGK